VQYLDIHLPANTSFTHHIDTTLRGFIYVYEGDVAVVATHLPQHSFAVMGEGDNITVTAGKDGARFIVVAGKPIGEPIVQYGPFVMTSMDDIKQAIADYNNGKLVQQQATHVPGA
jgi:quercetin 2,3-dioxygenase